MQKRTLGIVASLMLCTILALLYVLFHYYNTAYIVRSNQLNAYVNNSIDIALEKVEINCLEKRLSKEKDILDSCDCTYQRLKNYIKFHQADTTQYGFSRIQNSGGKQLFTTIKAALSYFSNIEDTRPLVKKIKLFDYELHQCFKQTNCGIDNIPFHYCVINCKGDTLLNCVDFATSKDNRVFEREVPYIGQHKDDASTLYIHFPTLENQLRASTHSLLGIIVIVFVILILFQYTCFQIFKQIYHLEMKYDFINNMTHEFKTPISSISLGTQILQDTSTDIPAETKQHVTKVIVNETKRLRFQIDKMLQMAVLEDNTFLFKPRFCDINNILQEVLDIFKVKMDHIEGNLSVQLNARHTIVVGDEMHLTNIFFNLMDNAIKYRNTSRDFNLTITTNNDRRRNLYVSIEDNGIGIKKEDIKKIFDKFYRSNTKNIHNVKGFGLGLAYVYKIVKLHHGTIYAESTYGTGATFTIELPTTNEMYI